jgi:hypothetical protein
MDSMDDDKASAFLARQLNETNELNFIRFCERKLNHTENPRVDITTCVEKMRLAFGLILRPFY